MSEKKEPSVLDGFKAFLMRGNVVDLAVAVVIGAAFTNIVNSVVRGVINPLVAAVMMPLSSITVLLGSWYGRSFDRTLRLRLRQRSNTA